MNQFAHLISTNYLDIPTNCWLPSTDKIAPMHSKQVAAGIYTRMPLGFRLNVEAYYKTMDNLLEYSGTNTLFPPLDTWESSFYNGKGRAYGLETEFGWISPTLFRYNPHSYRKGMPYSINKSTMIASDLDLTRNPFFA